MRVGYANFEVIYVLELAKRMCVRSATINVIFLQGDWAMGCLMLKLLAFLLPNRAVCDRKHVQVLMLFPYEKFNRLYNQLLFRI